MRATVRPIAAARARSATWQTAVAAEWANAEARPRAVRRAGSPTERAERVGMGRSKVPRLAGLVFLVVVLFLSGLSSSAQAADVSPPQFASLAISPSSVDVANGPATVT